MYLVVPPGGCFPETRRIELGPGALTIGRAEACEIRVDVPGVDQEHAKISEVALIALGPDCAIGDVPLDAGSRRLLIPGDEIQIGSVVVAVEGEDPSAAPDSPGSRRLGSPHPEGARVRIVEGSNFGDELLIADENREYTIGRGASCDLVVDDREVSREHVKIVRRGFTVFVVDLSSTRGSWLGRAAVYSGATVEWARPRMLRLGATVLSLELPEAVRRAAPGAHPSAPMTPPPRNRNGFTMPQPTPSAPTSARGSHALTPAPSEPPAGTPSAAVVAVAAASTARLAPYAPAPATEGPQPMLAPPAAASPFHPGELRSPSGRKAWKKTGPTIGRASGFLLLALAGLAIAGALFVVFSLLE